jgi:zinc transport system substrate-binding protein
MAAAASKRTIIAVVLAATIAACGGSGGAANTTGRLQVVTAFYPLEMIANRLGGDSVAVTNLTPPGGEPHDLELKPSDVRKVRGADLIFYLDDGFQPTLEDVIRTFSGRDRAVDMLAGLQLRRPSGENEEGLTIDPHVWLSPPLLEKIVDSAAAVLEKRLPDEKETVRSRVQALKADIERLDGDFRAGLSNCRRIDIFTSHAAFAYLADRYGLRQVALTGLSPEAEPTSKHLQDVAKQARASGATTIFFETLVSPRVADSVARIVGAKTAVLDPIEGLTPEEKAAGEDYFSIMRKNLSALRKALDCSS